MRKYLHTFIKLSLIIYILFIIYAMFLKSRGNWTNLTFGEYLLYQSNFIPFKTIVFYIKSVFDGNINLDIPIINLSCNLLMFMPAAIYLPLYVKRIKTLKSCIVAMLSILVFIELIQFLTRRGSFDIDDLILNILGVIIGYQIWRIRFIQRLLSCDDGVKSAHEQHPS